MPLEPTCSILANNIFVQGVREFGPIAKRRGLETRDAAFFVIHHMLKEFSTFTGKELLEYPDEFGMGKVSNLDTKTRLRQGLWAEYGVGVVPEWMD